MAIIAISLFTVMLLTLVAAVGAVYGSSNNDTNTKEDTDEEETADIEQQTNENNINPCLLDPSNPDCPKPDENQNCPEGWAQNEDGNCFPLHPDGCPEGYHSHENDETGRCIPDSTPCEPGYAMDPDFPTCSSIDSICRDHPDEDVCGGPFNNNKNNDDNNDNDNDNDNDNNNDDSSYILNLNLNYTRGFGVICISEEKEKEDNNSRCRQFVIPTDPRAFYDRSITIG